MRNILRFANSKKITIEKLKFILWTRKRVYTFGNGQAEGKADMKNLLGGKGANLAEMNLIGGSGSSRFYNHD